MIKALEPGLKSPESVCLNLSEYLYLTSVLHQTKCKLASYPGRSLIKKTAWQLIRVQTVDFRCPGVGSTNQISERFT